MTSDAKGGVATVYQARVIECSNLVDAQKLMDALTLAIGDSQGALNADLNGKQVILFPSHSWLVISPEDLEKILANAAIHIGLSLVGLDLALS